MGSGLRVIVVSGLLTLIGATVASAICLDTDSGGVNQCEFARFSGTDGAANLVFGGVQDGHACFGSMSIVGGELAVSWTMNTSSATVQYMCRLDLATLTGTGTSHAFFSQPFSSWKRDYACSLSASCPSGAPAPERARPDGVLE